MPRDAHGLRVTKCRFLEWLDGSESRCASKLNLPVRNQIAPGQKLGGRIRRIQMFFPIMLICFINFLFNISI